MPKVETAFTITVNPDGTLTSYTKLPEEPFEVNRVATNFDVFQVAKQIVEEFETQLLVDRVATAIVNSQPLADRIGEAVATRLSPEPTKISDKVKEKLAERGITPEAE
ncbi:hypothetical protein UFOVP45_90 [uncultured Caudovirales phage]|uniref:Uncharacterized protein n=1 Tax=uncultured Caudovirales phage TaxID=2100421 RepID=A0A6J5KSZ2_9CAUD|nr:hypothetical protein UFOVP45_90 [uncultured Caudovirales phage]